jgi:hypothetical protein
VGVEKLHFRQNSENLGDRKCLGKPRTSFVGHPSAKFFQPFSDERVFQQPQAITLIDRSMNCNGGFFSNCQADHPRPEMWPFALTGPFYETYNMLRLESVPRDWCRPTSVSFRKIRTLQSCQSSLMPESWSELSCYPSLHCDLPNTEQVVRHFGVSHREVTLQYAYSLGQLSSIRGGTSHDTILVQRISQTREIVDAGPKNSKNAHPRVP